MDNITAPATGAVLATKDIGGVQFPRNLLTDASGADITAANRLPVDVAFPATQAVSIAAPVAVTGSFYPATQPVSIASTVAVSGTVTFSNAFLPVRLQDASGASLGTSANPIYVSGGGSGGGGTPTGPAGTPNANVVSVQGISGATAIPVIGAFFQATQPVSGTVSISGTVPVSGPLTDTQLRATALPVSGTFFQATQPISATALPLPAGAATSAKQDAIVAALGTPLQAGGNVAVTASALPTGAATAAKQDTQTAAISTIGTRTYAAGISALAVSTSNAASAGVSATEVLLHASAKLFVRVGAAATVNDIPLEAGEKFTLRITSGQTINAITASGTATLNIVPVT